MHWSDRVEAANMVIRQLKMKVLPYWGITKKLVFFNGVSFAKNLYEGFRIAALWSWKDCSYTTYKQKLMRNTFDKVLKEITSKLQ